MNFNLENKVALVTGGSRGLGRGICLELASEKAVVVVNYRKNADMAKAVVDEIKDKYKSDALMIGGDITKEDDVRKIFSEIIKQFTRIDILINNAGICPISMVKDMTLNEWEDILKTNMTGTFLTCREMINILIKNKKSGKIVNVASQSAFNGSAAGKSHYAASKGGVVSFTGSLAKEVAPYGINVNAVAPGMMYTDMTSKTLDVNMDKYKREIPLGRVADIEEVAKVVAFLSSDVSSYITGTTIDVSGGIVGR
jgi:3-oxoacyl-[acyl-carrier protein] reductase